MNLLVIKPMFGIFMLGGLELIFILAGLFLAILVPVAVVVIVVLILRKSDHRPVDNANAASPLRPVPAAPASAPAPVAAPDQAQAPEKTTAHPPPPPPAPFAVPAPSPAMPTKTEVMVRKCPQCGAVLQPDVPEGLCPACLLQRGFATESGGQGPEQSQAQTTSAFVPPAVEELARLFPQLEVIGCLGRGGMGAVYKARQPRLDRFVALKILAPEKQNDPQFAERFEREARVLARLSHPNIVSVYDFGEVQGRYYLIMEFVDGLTLRQVMQLGKVSPAEALELVPKICEALQYAHGQGIVHRDIKPENILLDKQGRVKIADFGIAKIAGVEAKGLSLTGARDVMGTPVYMAPEQVEKPQSVDHRADIYSLGVVFYEMLTGELPLGKFAPPSKKVQVDVRLDDVVLHALEKEPARRYQEASQVKTAVETIAGTPSSSGAGPAAAAVNAAAGIGDPAISDKIILPAFLLAFFFGIFGAHRFYAGKYGTAVVQLLTCGGFGIWSMIDWILLVCGVFTDADGRRMKNWVHPGPTLPRMPAVSATTPAPQTGTGGAPVAPTQRDLFWRRFAIVAGCVLLFVLLAAVLLPLLLVSTPAQRFFHTTRYPIIVNGHGVGGLPPPVGVPALPRRPVPPTPAIASPQTPVMQVVQTEPVAPMLPIPKQWWRPGSPYQEPADRAAEAWLKSVDAGNYSDCWDQGATILQAGVTNGAFVKSMETFRLPLGDMLSRELTGTQGAEQVQGVPDGEYVLLKYRTRFTNQDAADETVMMSLGVDGHWRPACYFVQIIIPARAP